MLVVVGKLPFQELLESFLTAGSDRPVIPCQRNHGVSWEHSLLLQPIRNSRSALPVVTRSVQDSVLVGAFDDPVKGNKRDILFDQRLLACLGRV